MKVIVAGSRSFRDYKVLCKVLDEMEITTIISGGARGADKLGERYAKERGMSLEQYPAQWDRYGNQAGFIRNKERIAHLNDQHRQYIPMTETVLTQTVGGARLEQSRSA